MRSMPCAAIFMLGASPLLAESPRNVMFPSDASCYLRDYSADHLAKHPKQRVSSIALRPEGALVEDATMTVWVTVTLRDQPGEDLVALTYCQVADADRMDCLMEGDAGAFSLAPAKGGAVLVTVAKAGMGFDGATDFVTLRSDSGDDRSFLVKPTGDCR
jgi:hypothetical protein